MNIAHDTPGAQPGPPKTFPADRVGTSFTAEESETHWLLGYLYPAGDVPSEPADWPDWSDADCWAIGPPPSARRPRQVPDAPSETDYPF